MEASLQSVGTKSVNPIKARVSTSRARGALGRAAFGSKTEPSWASIQIVGTKSHPYAESRPLQPETQRIGEREEDSGAGVSVTGTQSFSLKWAAIR